jgi:hypothetical protein
VGFPELSAPAPRYAQSALKDLCLKAKRLPTSQASRTLCQKMNYGRGVVRIVGVIVIVVAIRFLVGVIKV